MTWLSDGVLLHLCQIADLPDLADTRYDLVEKIGQGGMGSVYLVRDRELDRLVALKVVNDPTGATPDRTRMLDECFVHKVLVFDRLAYRRIKNLLFYLGVNRERVADLLRDAALGVHAVVLPLLVALEEILDVAVVGHQQGEGERLILR